MTSRFKALLASQPLGVGALRTWLKHRQLACTPAQRLADPALYFTAWRCHAFLLCQPMLLEELAITDSSKQVRPLCHCLCRSRLQ